MWVFVGAHNSLKSTRAFAPTWDMLNPTIGLRRKPRKTLQWSRRISQVDSPTAVISAANGSIRSSYLKPHCNGAFRCPPRRSRFQVADERWTACCGRDCLESLTNTTTIRLLVRRNCLILNWNQWVSFSIWGKCSYPRTCKAYTADSKNHK